MRRSRAILLLPLLAATSCSESRVDRRATAAPAPIPVRLAGVTRQPVERVEPLTGTLHGVAEVTLSAQVSGRILELAADLGDRVAPGGIVARLDATEHRLALNQREAALAETLAHLGLQRPPQDDFDLTRVPAVERARRLLAQAESRLARGREYRELETPVISGEQLDDLATAVEVARTDVERETLLTQARVAEVKTRVAELRAAEHRVHECTVTAPVHTAPAGDGGNGTWEVAARHVEVGELVAPATALFDLVMRDRIVLRAALPERLLGRVAIGATVAIQTEGDAGPFVGKLDRIAPAVDQRTRSFRIEARFDNHDRRLRPGAFARGTVAIGRDEQVLLVPRAALVQFAGVEKLFSVRDGHAIEHLVSSGVSLGDLVEIRSELAGVSEVVTDGAQRLADGLPVTSDASSSR